MGDALLDVADGCGQQPLTVAVAKPAALLGALLTVGTKGRRSLGLDQGLEALGVRCCAYRVRCLGVDVDVDALGMLRVWARSRIGSWQCSLLITGSSFHPSLFRIESLAAEATRALTETELRGK